MPFNPAKWQSFRTQDFGLLEEGKTLFNVDKWKSLKMVSDEPTLRALTPEIKERFRLPTAIEEKEMSADWLKRKGIKRDLLGDFASAHPLFPALITTVPAFELAYIGLSKLPRFSQTKVGQGIINKLSPEEKTEIASIGVGIPKTPFFTGVDVPIKMSNQDKAGLLMDAIQNIATYLSASGVEKIASTAIVENSVKVLGGRIEAAGYGTGKVIIPKEHLKKIGRYTPSGEAILNNLTARTIPIKPTAPVPFKKPMAGEPFTPFTMTKSKLPPVLKQISTDIISGESFMSAPRPMFPPALTPTSIQQAMEEAFASGELGYQLKLQSWAPTISPDAVNREIPTPLHPIEAVREAFGGVEAPKGIKEIIKPEVKEEAIRAYSKKAKEKIEKFKAEPPKPKPPTFMRKGVSDAWHPRMRAPAILPKKLLEKSEKTELIFKLEEAITKAPPEGMTPEIYKKVYKQPQQVKIKIGNWELKLENNKMSLDAFKKIVQKRGEVYIPEVVNIEVLKEVKDKLVSTFDIEYPFAKIGAPKTGVAIKTYLSKRTAGEEKTLRAIQNLNKFGLAQQEFTELAFLAENPSLLDQLSQSQKDKYSPAYDYVRKYFDDYWKELKRRAPQKFELPFPQSHIRRLQQQNIHLKEAINKTKNPIRATKLKKELSNNESLIDFYRTSGIQYVHIPVRVWLGNQFAKNPQLEKMLLSGTFKSVTGRETPTLDDFVKAGLVKRESVDIRDIMSIYGRYVENQFAQLDILEMGIEEGVSKPAGEAPEEWTTIPVQYAPMLKGYKHHPGYVELLEDYFRAFSKSKGGIGRIMSSVKMMQFYNPIFLPMYDVLQSAWAGALTTPKMPINIVKAIKDVKNKTPEYFKAYEEGLFSTPFSNPFNNYIKQVEEVKQSINNGNLILQALNKIKGYALKPQQIIGDIYNASWNIAWSLDKVLRMSTRNYLIDKKLPSLQASQLAAKFHGDYASVPPKLRRLLNKIFFTPTFEIVMNKVYIGMLKAAANPKVWIGKGTKVQNIQGRALIITAGILFGKDAVMYHGFGFEREQFSRRYYKKVETEEGEKELVIVFSNPANIWLRYYWKFKQDEADTNKLMRTAKTVFSRVHPVYRIAKELVLNESDDFKPIYNPFDDAHIIALDILRYTTAKAVRVSEGVLRGEEVKTQKTQQALIDATNKFYATILRPISFRYIRGISDQRIKYRINNLYREFDKTLTREPDMDEKRYNERLKNFEKMLDSLEE